MCTSFLKQIEGNMFRNDRKRSKRKRGRGRRRKRGRNRGRRGRVSAPLLCMDV